MSFATLNNSIDKYLRDLEKRNQDRLNVIGAYGVTEANKNIRKNGNIDTSNLINSINYATATTQGGLQGNTDGKYLSQPNSPQSVKIGTTVVYGRRIELGFTGQDSLGRNYNQPPYPYLRLILKNKKKIINIFTGK